MWRDTRRRRRNQQIDRFENLQQFCTVPAPEFLRAIDHRRRHHRARDQAVTDCGIEIVRPLAQAVEMQRSAYASRSEEHTSELQSQFHLVCRLLLEKKKKKNTHNKLDVTTT